MEKQNLPGMMNDSFLTIANPTEGIYKEKGSKFLSFVFPVNSEADVKRHVEELKKNHFDARHHCYAYILGADKSKTRANDDGEPAHTAGTPIINQIKSTGLTNILVVVVRYFGGTKLGVPGLISAYKQASADALQQVEVIEKLVEKTLIIKTSFESMNEGLKLIKQHQGRLIDQQFDNNLCLITTAFRLSFIEVVISKINGLQAIGVAISLEEELIND